MAVSARFCGVAVGPSGMAKVIQATSELSLNSARPVRPKISFRFVLNSPKHLSLCHQTTVALLCSGRVRRINRSLGRCRWKRARRGANQQACNKISFPFVLDQTDVATVRGTENLLTYLLQTDSRILERRASNSSSVIKLMSSSAVSSCMCSSAFAALLLPSAIPPTGAAVWW